MKNQISINGETGKIICVNEAKGATHDFQLFKNSKVHISENILLVADKGYM
ncbi:MAG: IS5/IS1182 family transposase, partial [Oscillospiraceae bacterium]|nr:IS5/IS1182 family transposase [Oscillospiraceae bacterium]